jgi:hypothetical protein
LDGETKERAMAWFREEHVPRRAEDAERVPDREQQPPWLKPVPASLEAALAELSQLVRFALPCLGEVSRPSTVNDPLDFADFAALKGEIDGVPAAKPMWPRTEAWIGRYVKVTAETKPNPLSYASPVLVISANTCELERHQGILFGSNSPQAMASMRPDTLIGVGLFAANPCLWERVGQCALDLMRPWRPPRSGRAPRPPPRILIG